MSYSKLSSIAFGEDNWCLRMQPIYNRGLLTALSNGTVQIIDWNINKVVNSFQAHETPINDMKLINGDTLNATLAATAAEDSVKIFDVRSQELVATLKNEKSAPFVSLDSRHDILACGTELSGVDAELHLYDVRQWQQPVRSLVDSHHDDITTIKFHPSDPNVLLSGSTDGYVNVYDLTQDEEDDALHQVINFASIHTCGWSSPNRIYTLSHMETFGIHELNKKQEESTEPKPIEFGDIRKPWDCNYVVDVCPGFIATGKTEEGRGELKLIPFINETVNLGSAITIPHAHGDEVIRDVLVPAPSQELLYSCGEDGRVNVWKSSSGPVNVPTEFWPYSQAMDMFKGELPQVEMAEIDENPDNSPEPSPAPSQTFKKRKSKDKKKAPKGSKGASKSFKNASKHHRFQPY
ncbi:LAME_0G12772g1_1 [Lachancea meyersii CBS 8951]|uniref:LAME_0G12772g1_1 n=1 Tax=Lachancea meyersii CBS 8951 TaxID=1266667 RepID=A0A1G4K9V3_9SACH|nr:LAME_0G12772g1_1 [Lachancea meyersii CBS 8951]